MKVSIIIPVYNASKYLIRCLDSVSAQTYQELECILVDDCGKDNSVVMAKEYMESYNGPISFRLLHHEHNSGAAAARNTGIRAATGEYLFFLDSDDSLVDNCIETLLSLYEKHPDIDLAQGNALSEDGHISPYGFPHDMPEYTNDKEELYRIQLSETTTAPWNRLVKKEFVLKHNLFFPEGYFTEDMYWCYFMAKHVRAAAFCNSGLYVYYINEGSMMTSPANHIRWYNSRIWTSWRYLEDMEQNGSNKYQRQYLAINLLSCPAELKALKSLQLWFHFWKNVCSIALKYRSHITIYRLLFILCLMPPICFIAAKKNFRWRIQQMIISKV